MAKIMQATPEQWRQIEEIRTRWLAEQTRDVSPEDVVCAVHGLYRLVDFSRLPLVFQVDGPIHCAAMDSIGG